MEGEKLIKTMPNMGPLFDNVLVEFLLNSGAYFEGTFQHKLTKLPLFVGSRCGPNFSDFSLIFNLISVTLET